MAATAAIDEIKFDETIQSRPELLTAAQDATDFFSAHYFKGPTVEPPVPTGMKWVVFRVGSEERVGVEFTEQDAAGWRRFGKSIPIQQMLNPVARDIWMLQLWQDVLSHRSEAQMRKVDRLIAELEAGEQNGHAH
jgi:hypothetical protein